MRMKSVFSMSNTSLQSSERMGTACPLGDQVLESDAPRHVMIRLSRYE
jgi:hypothetical protein